MSSTAPVERVPFPIIGATAGAFLALAGAVLALSGWALPGAALLVLLGTVAWVALCHQEPLSAFAVLVFVWVLAYARLSTQVVDLAGPSTTNRGGIALGDLLWLVFVAILLLRPSTWRCDLRGLRQGPSWAMAPYFLGATTLPFLGVVVGGWPISFASPGVRFAQWLSFLPLAFLVAREEGSDRVVRVLFRVLVVAGALHAAYGLVQLGVQLGALPDVLIRLDAIHAARNAVSWFFFARVTGFLVNPNHYGLFGVLLLVAGVSWLMAAPREGRLGGQVAVAAALVPLALSGSRSALAAALGVTGYWLLLALSGNRTAVRLLRMVPAALALGLVMAVAVWRVLPEVLRARYRRMIAVFVYGTAAEQNLTARFGFWREAWQAYWTDYPAGTWVAPSHVLHSAIDSYYVFTAVQGSPLFTGFWIMAMGAVFVLGILAYRESAASTGRAAGLMLSGWSLALLISSLTMSPLLQIQLSIPFWSLVGVVLAIRTESRTPAGAP